ncbi:hypothetical protein MMPV_003622 [Pyropia vietnamensis]
MKHSPPSSTSPPPPPPLLSVTLLPGTRPTRVKAALRAHFRAALPTIGDAEAALRLVAPAGVTINGMPAASAALLKPGDVLALHPAIVARVRAARAAARAVGAGGAGGGNPPVEGGNSVGQSGVVRGDRGSGGGDDTGGDGSGRGVYGDSDRGGVGGDGGGTGGASDGGECATDGAINLAGVVPTAGGVFVDAPGWVLVAKRPGQPLRGTPLAVVEGLPPPAAATGSPAATAVVDADGAAATVADDSVLSGVGRPAGWTPSHPPSSPEWVVVAGLSRPVGGAVLLAKSPAAAADLNAGGIEQTLRAVCLWRGSGGAAGAAAAARSDPRLTVVGGGRCTAGELLEVDVRVVLGSGGGHRREKAGATGAPVVTTVGDSRRAISTVGGDERGRDSGEDGGGSDGGGGNGAGAVAAACPPPELIAMRPTESLRRELARLGLPVVGTATYCVPTNGTRARGAFLALTRLRIGTAFASAAVTATAVDGCVSSAADDAAVVNGGSGSCREWRLALPTKFDALRRREALFVARRNAREAAEYGPLALRRLGAAANPPNVQVDPAADAAVHETRDDGRTPPSPPPFGVADAVLAAVPLAYTHGRKKFCGLTLAVTPDVMVPRPATEVLVAAVLDALRGVPPPAAVLDAGTGSGNIAVAVAVAATVAVGAADASIAAAGTWATGTTAGVAGATGPSVAGLTHGELAAGTGGGSGDGVAAPLAPVRVVGVDTCAAALTVAATNVDRQGVGDLVTLGAGDFAALADSAAVVAGAPYDVLVANPPYLTPAEHRGRRLGRLTTHEPAAALVYVPTSSATAAAAATADGGGSSGPLPAHASADADGLGAYRAIAGSLAAAGRRLLAPDGAVVLEVPTRRVTGVVAVMAGAGLVDARRLTDPWGSTRCVVFRWAAAAPAPAAAATAVASSKPASSGRADSPVGRDAVGGGDTATATVGTVDGETPSPEHTAMSVVG